MKNYQIRAAAREKLHNNYFYAFLFSLLGNWIISAGPSVIAGSSLSRIVTNIVTNGGGIIFSFHSTFLSVLATLVGMILAGSINVGLASYYIKLCDRNNPSIDDISAPFKNFVNMLKAYFLSAVYIFLKSLLLIIPGIAEYLSLSLTPYILAEHPEMDAKDAMNLSKSMMKGNRCRLIGLYLGFTGWFILCLFTFGIGLAFLRPYLSATMAEFFNEISGKNYEKQLKNSNFGAYVPYEEV